MPDNIQADSRFCSRLQLFRRRSEPSGLATLFRVVSEEPTGWMVERVSLGNSDLPPDRLWISVVAWEIVSAVVYDPGESADSSADDDEEILIP